jgi:hypothetical protein
MHVPAISAHVLTILPDLDPPEPWPTSLAEIADAVDTRPVCVEVNINFNGFKHRDVTVLRGTRFYGSSLFQVAKQHRIVLQEVYAKIKDAYAEKLYKTGLEFKLKTIRQRFDLCRIPYFDEFCPEDHVAWHVRARLIKSKLDWSEKLSDIGEFVSGGRHRNAVPLTPVRSREIVIPPGIFALPVECVSEVYLWQDH